MPSNVQTIKPILARSPMVAVNHVAAREDTLVKLEVRHTASVLVALKVEVSARVAVSASNSAVIYFNHTIQYRDLANI